MPPIPGLNPLPIFSPFQMTARWNELVETNAAPLQVELNTVWDLQQDAQRAVRFLEQELRKAKELVRQCETIQSPFRKIPPEIIGEIIKHALGHYSDDPTPVTLNTSVGPWPLSQVSRAWRAVVLSSPTLWSQISIGWEPSYILADPDVTTALCIFSTIIDRSGPLELCGNFNDKFLPAASLIIKHSHRWRQLNLFARYPLSLMLLNGTRKTFPFLESLMLDIRLALDNYEGVRGSPSPTITAFTDSPLLHSLNVPFSYKNLHRILAGIPWEQITRYDGPIYLPGIISRLSALESGELWTRRDIRRNEVPGKTLLPHLRSLTVGDTTVLDYLTLPALQTLHSNGASLLDIRRMVERSNCSLKSLTVHEMTNQTIKMLWLMPSITNLRIVDDGWSCEDFLNKLMPDVPNPVLLPRLEHLSLEIRACGRNGRRHNLVGHTEVPIADLVLARINAETSGISRLRTVCCDIQHCCNAFAYKDVESLKLRFRTDPLYTAVINIVVCKEAHSWERLFNRDCSVEV